MHQRKKQIHKTAKRSTIRSTSMQDSHKNGTPPTHWGDVPHRRSCLSSEITEVRAETVEGVPVGIRHRSESVEAFGVRLRHRSESGEATEGRHRHHPEAACKRRRHRAEVGVLHAISVEASAGGDDFDRYFRFRRGGFGPCFTGRPALGSPFRGREFRSVFRFCRQDRRPGCVGLSSEDLHKAEKADGQHGQEERGISRSGDQRICCLSNSNSVCRNILNSLLTARCFCSRFCSNNAAEKCFIVPDTLFRLVFFCGVHAEHHKRSRTFFSTPILRDHFSTTSTVTPNFSSNSESGSHGRI